MENKPVFTISFIYGLIVSILLVVFKLTLFIFDIDDKSYWQIIYYVIFALGLLYSMILIRDKNLDGSATFGKAFKIGFFATIAVSIIMAIYTYVYMTVINPGMVTEMMDKAQENIINANPDMSDEQIDQALSAAKMFMKPGIMSLTSIIGTLITGTLLSLVSAAFAKKNKVFPTEEFKS